ncbi:unnamed protein product [Candida verbasci]|uniref:Sec1-like protein n=1 Tax=Candida verbasci TaxID=1227364 RepID=A0A9W4U1X4_9ASCO|nr:unnamed protein product [Candida verbasci]
MALDLYKVKDVYFNKLYQPRQNASEQIKPKVLLLDKITTTIISMSYTQSQLLSNDIILIELIENYKTLSVMKHLNCIVFVSIKSLSSLISELKSPHFGSYEIYFNNSINKNQIEKIAESDEYEIVDKLIEIFQDYLILNSHLYQIQHEPGAINPYLEDGSKLTSLLLSLKKNPIIKYESNSNDIKRLSSEILYNINSNSNNNLFDDLNIHNDVPPILLLLDRKNDPITPLITPWTYQSMIHEFCKIEKNLVNIENQQIILTDSNDQFYKESMYLNYGDLTDKFQKYVEKYKSETNQSQITKTSNLNELKKILMKFPEFKKFSTNILNHLNIISEIDKQISLQKLWDLGELQQTIVCDLDSQQNIKERIITVLKDSKISTTNKVKILLLYSIRFNFDQSFLSILNDPLCSDPLPSEEQVNLLSKFKSLFNLTNLTNIQKQQQQQGLTNIFANKNINISNLFKNHQNENDNIYLQYTPRLNEIINKLIDPNLESSVKLNTLIPDKVKQKYGTTTEKVQDIIIYMNGGLTYEESRLIHEISENNKKINLIIGSDEMLNSETWLNKLYNLTKDKQTEPERTQFRDLL